MLKISKQLTQSIRTFSIQCGHVSDRIVLRDGNTIPLFGLGCYKLNKELTETSVLSALNYGYRLIDTAEAYANESFVGSAIQKCGIPRKDIYVITKLSSENGYKESKETCLKSLKILNLDYIDLYLIHSPTQGKVIETWKAFIELQNDGLVKSIGVSNFNIHQLEPLRQHGFPMPVVNQIEHHPWYQQTKLMEYCKDVGIVVMGYCPLARTKYFENESVIHNTANTYHKTVCQILLRWSLQKNIVTIPKSSQQRRIIENADIYDFSLSDEEMQEISKLNSNRTVSTVTALSDPWLG